MTTRPSMEQLDQEALELYSGLVRLPGTQLNLQTPQFAYKYQL